MVVLSNLFCKYARKWCKVLSFHRSKFYFVGEVNMKLRVYIYIYEGGEGRDGGGRRRGEEEEEQEEEEEEEEEEEKEEEEEGK